MKNLLRFILGIFGNITAFALFLSPVITFYKVYKKGSTEEFSGIPYVVTIQNCLLFAWYGLPFITTHNILVTTINGSGAAIEFIYICLFLIFAPPKPRRKILILFIGGMAFFTAVGVISLTALQGNKRKLFVGSIAATFSASVYAAPLSIMVCITYHFDFLLLLRFFLLKIWSYLGLFNYLPQLFGWKWQRLVVQTKSVEYMPFLLSFCGFLCSASWSLYGILGRDVFVTIPNCIGTLLGVAQLILYFRYKDFSPAKCKEDTSNGNCIDHVMSLPSSKLELTLEKHKSAEEWHNGKKQSEVTLPQPIS